MNPEPLNAYKRCIIIPSFNEGENIAAVIQGVKKYSDADIVVIDDGSTDLTAEKAGNAGAFVISHPFNMGYGVALQTGYKYAVKERYDILVQIDGDGQHDPKTIPDMFEQVETYECDVVIGSRFLSGGGYRIGALKSTGISLLRAIVRLFCGEKITDPTSGYQCLSRKVFQVLTEDSFPSDYPDANIIIMYKKRGFSIKEIPVVMFPNPEGRSMHQGIFTVMYYFFKIFLSTFITLIKGK